MQTAEKDSIIERYNRYDDIALEEGYIPSRNEEYMCDKHLAFFRRKLMNWKNDLQKESAITVEHLKQESLDEPDLSDRATAETDITLELKNRNEWTPKRSIIFFSWDAEEYSLTGSIEFVEVYLLTF